MERRLPRSAAPLRPPLERHPSPLDRSTGLAARCTPRPAPWHRPDPCRAGNRKRRAAGNCRRSWPRDDLLDPVDRRRLALLEQARGLLAAQLGQGADTVVADRRKVRGGARCHATGDPAAVEHDHRAPGHHQLIGGRKPRDAGADDHRIGLVPHSACVPGATSTPSRATGFVRLRRSSTFLRDVAASFCRYFVPLDTQAGTLVSLLTLTERRRFLKQRRTAPRHKATDSERKSDGPVFERHQDDGRPVPARGCRTSITPRTRS